MDIEEEADIYFADEPGNINEVEKDYAEEEGHNEGGEHDDALDGVPAESGDEGDPGYDDDNADDAYEIRDEEEENTLELSREAGGGSESKSTEEKKDENMLVVDEWDNEDIDSVIDEEETAEDSNVKVLDPEDSEHWLLNMPSLQSVMGDLLHLRRNRRLSVYPVTVEDIVSPTVQTILASDKCEEAKMQFVRPAADIKKWSGFLALTFVTSKAATKAIDELKKIKETLTVKVDANPDQSMEQFIKDGRKSLAWPTFWADKLLLVQGISADTKAEELRVLFPGAEEISVVKESSSSESSRRRPSSSESATSVAGYAYVLYESAEEAKAVAEECASKHMEFNDKPIDVKLYREPVTGPLPRGLLSLRRRKVVLRHLDRLTRNLEKSRKDPSHKIAPWTEKRITACKSVIEKDDKARTELKLSTPSLEDFKNIRGLRPYRMDECERILTSLGIVEKKSKPEPQNTSPHKDVDKSVSGAARKRSTDERLKKKSQPVGGRGGFRRARRGRRQSPLGGRRRDWSPPADRSGRFMGRNRGGPLGGLEAAALMNPLALMMQQNLGLVGGVNPALLNQMLLTNPAAVAMLGGTSGGSGAMPFMGGPGPGPRGHDLEPSSKMLRLDESGTFRDRDYRGDRDGRGFDSHRDRDRDDRGPYRDRGGRHRSRTPEFLRAPSRAIGGGGRGGGMRGFEGGPGGMRGDAGGRGYPDSGSGTSGAGPVREEDINMLMNLSKMLSQKMEQKRQQVEHGGYDRM
jgi:hypothetical protein